jgi:hypothetical protein
MDPLLRLGMHLSRLWRNPPSRRRALFMLAAIALSVAVVAIEHFGWWPERWQINAPATRPGLSRI